MYYTIFVSDVAACVCKHPFKKRGEVALKMLKRMCPDVYRVSCEKYGYKDDETILESIQLPTQATISAADVEINISTALAQSESMKMSVKDRHQLEKCVTSKFNTSLGINKENDAIRSLEESLGEPINRDQTLYKRCLVKDEWYLCGRVDGISASGVVVEVKNRVKRLFGKVPNYERIQVLCYMHLLQRQKAVLAECYEGQLKHYHLEYDDEEWKKIESGLTDFVQYMETLMKSEEDRERLFYSML